MDQERYRFSAIIGHKDPLKATDSNWNGSKWNVQIEWETGEITFEPLSVIAADKYMFGFSYQEIILKLWNLTKLTTTVNGMMLQRLNWTPCIHMRCSKSMKR